MYKMSAQRYPWFGQQTWSHIFFAHWPINKYQLLPFIPYPLQLDTFNKSAWLTIVAFQASDSRLRYLPKSFAFPSFWQINVRTYIQLGSERGVYFFTLYSNDKRAVRYGKWSGLPYLYAPLTIEKNNGTITLTKDRKTHSSLVSQVDLSYDRTNKLPNKKLNEWLTNRDTIFLIRRKEIIKSYISHDPWELYNVKGGAAIKGLAHPIKDEEIQRPLLMTAEDQTAFLHPFQTIGYISHT